jgi:ABC-2 type transport system ATP-binding protein
MAIVVNGVTKTYGAQNALNNVSFRVEPGQVVGFLGPNGAGKSTMMKIITCFLPPTTGTVTVDGFDVLEQPVEVRQRVGYLPEHNPLYLDMYVREFLLFVARIHLRGSEAQRQVQAMIDLTGLGVEQHKKIGALSKGYRQRVGLAQAMIHNPGVLILDEPTTGLDPNQLSEIRKLIADLGREKTVILSTHIMQEVEAMCNRVMIINAGEIVADEPTAQLRSRVTGSMRIRIEFDKPMSADLLRTVTGVLKVSREKDTQWVIDADPSKDVRQELFKLAVENGASVLTLQKLEQNLEDVFRQLTVDK